MLNNIYFINKILIQKCDKKKTRLNIIHKTKSKQRNK